MRPGSIFSVVMAIATIGTVAAAAPDQGSPLQLSLEHRTRYEHLAGDYRDGAPTTPVDALFLRTLALARL